MMKLEQLGCQCWLGKFVVAGTVSILISKSIDVGCAQKAILHHDTEEALWVPLHCSGLCDPPLWNSFEA